MLIITDNWLKRNLEDSGFLHLGYLRTKDQAELEKAFNQILPGVYDTSDVGQKLKHYEDLTPLPELAQALGKK